MELNAAKKGKEKAEKIRCLNREQMKIIAAASMVCDHICMIMLPGNPAAQIVRDTVGRFSFLIFLALFIDGFFLYKKRKLQKAYTRSCIVCASVVSRVFVRKNRSMVLSGRDRQRDDGISHHVSASCLSAVSQRKNCCRCHSGLRSIASGMRDSPCSRCQLYSRRSSRRVCDVVPW